MLVLALLEELGTVHLEKVYLFSHVVDLGIDHVQSLLVLVLRFDVDLNEKLPSLLFLSELDGVVACRLLLAADFNGCVYIEDGLV